MTDKINDFGRNLALFIGSLIFAVILAEFALRIALPAPIVWKYPQENYHFDHEIGHWLQANQHAFTHDKPVNTNSIGIRDSEYALQPPNGVYRILALGDSQTFGNGLDIEDTWPKQLESLLNKTGNGIPVEVLNGGLPASDTWQHEIIFHRMLKKYHPNAVVLAFYVNDVVTRHTPSPHQKKALGTLATRLIYTLKQSVLLLTLRNALNSIRQNQAANRQVTRQEMLLRGDNDPGLNESWQQVEKSLAAMQRTSKDQNLEFILASIPRRDQVSGQTPADAYIQNLQSIVEHQRVPLVNMLGPLQRSYEKHGQDLFIPWDGHNSRIANRVIAEQLSRVINVPRHAGTQ